MVHPRVKWSLAKTRKSGNSRSSLTTGAVPGTLPRLCFQPGVGWQRVPCRAIRGTSRSWARNCCPRTRGQRSQPAIDLCSVIERKASTRPIVVATSNQKALIAGAEEVTIFNRPASIRSAGSTTPGTVTKLQMNSPQHPHGSASFESGVTTPSAIPPVPTYAGSEAEQPNARADQVNLRAFHAYVSPIKLRRLIRNAPDYRTRIKLQQLENNPATQSRKPRVGAAARRPLPSRRHQPAAGQSPTFRCQSIAGLVFGHWISGE